MKDYFDLLRYKIDQALVSGLDSGGKILEAASHYALSVKGKRLRPLLFLTLVESSDQDPLEFMDIACGIEYIHTYSLIHDDLPAMDDDDFRRGMPTVHKKYNEAIAILTGDTLLTMAFERISGAQIPAEQAVNIIRILTHCIGMQGMAGGQVMDLEFQGKGEQIIEIHQKKTAQLIRGTLLSAAEVMGLGETQKKILSDAGMSIGTAFQMADDLLDVEGDEEVVGKKLHKDKANQSPNSVLFYGVDYVKKEIDFKYMETLDLLKQMDLDHPQFLYLIEKMVYREK